MKFYYIKHMIDLLIFDDETTALLRSFEICTEMHFVSLFSLSERNITTSLLMILLKLLLSKFKNRNKSFLSYRPLNILFCFFSIFYLFILTRLLTKVLWKSYHFLTQLSKIHIIQKFKSPKVQNSKVYYRILQCQTF